MSPLPVIPDYWGWSYHGWPYQDECGTRNFSDDGRNYYNPWGQILPDPSTPTNLNAGFELGAITFYIKLKSTGQWYTYEHGTVNDGYIFHGASALPEVSGTSWSPITGPDDGLFFKLGMGNWAQDTGAHFWPAHSHEWIDNPDVEHVAVSITGRIALQDPYGVDDRDQAKYLLGIGVDHRIGHGEDGPIIQGVLMSRHRYLTNEWQTFTMHSICPNMVEIEQPPIHGLITEPCAPKTCAQLGKECGIQNDGCGGTVNCGSCAQGFNCVNGTCEEAPPDDSTVVTFQQLKEDTTLPHEMSPLPVIPDYWGWSYHGWPYQDECGTRNFSDDGRNYYNPWGQILPDPSTPTNLNAGFELGAITFYIKLKSTGQWYTYEHGTVNDGYIFHGASALPEVSGTSWSPITGPDDGLFFKLGMGNWAQDTGAHFWPAHSHEWIDNPDVEHVAVSITGRIALQDPYGVDDRDQAKYLLGIGVDHRIGHGEDGPIIQGVLMSRHRYLTNEWQTFTMHSICPNMVEIEQPPIHGLITEPCAPKTCAQLGKECGIQNDGCGGTVNCGSCAQGFNCVNGQCIEEVFEEFKFTAYGDSRTGTNIHADIVDMILEDNVDLVIHTGDFVGTGTNWDEWQAQFIDIAFPLLDHEPSPGLTTFFYPSVGNHETIGSGWEANYFTVFDVPPINQHYYSFDYKNAHFVSLYVPSQWNPSDFDSNSAQYQWLDNDLAQAAADPNIKWKFVFFHAPVFSCVEEHGCGKNIQEYLIPLFDQYGVTAVFNGDDHSYQRIGPISGYKPDPTGVTYIVTAGGGAYLYDFYGTTDCNLRGGNPCDPSWTGMSHQAFPLEGGESVNHYMRFTVKENEVIGEAIRRNGTIIETFSLF